MTSEQDIITLRPLVILSENPIEQIWVQLSVWESVNLSRKLIFERARRSKLKLGAEKLERKAQALSYCIRTARENIRNPGAGLTVGSVGNYYGCMWLAAAILSADPANDIDLIRLEEFTKRGHGLGNFAGETGEFPDNEFLYVRESGFFREFLKARGVFEEYPVKYRHPRPSWPCGPSRRSKIAFSDPWVSVCSHSRTRRQV